MEDRYSYNLFLKKSNIWAMLSFESNPQCKEHVRLLQLTLTINITPIDITLCILEKNKSYKVMLKLS